MTNLMLLLAPTCQLRMLYLVYLSHQTLRFTLLPPPHLEIYLAKVCLRIMDNDGRQRHLFHHLCRRCVLSMLSNVDVL